MSFPQQLNDLHSIQSDIVNLSSLLTPATMTLLQKTGSIDLSKTDELISAVNTLTASLPEVKKINDNMGSVNAVVKSQNQIQNVSSIRDSIGLIAGSIDEIKKVADYANVFGAVVAMRPMIEEALKLSVKMDLVLDLEEKMDSLLEVEARLDAKLEEMKKIEEKTSRCSTLTADILNRVNIKEHRINEKLVEIKGYRDEMVDFTIDTEYISFDGESVSSYNPATNTLLLRIREGKQGIKGEPGNDGAVGQPGSAVHKGDRGDTGEPGSPGKALHVDAMGAASERKKFGNRPIGTTFLALDKSVPLLYFRKSNTTDDWTDGIPFGSNPIKHADNATNAEKFMGMTLAQLKAYLNK